MPVFNSMLKLHRVLSKAVGGAKGGFRDLELSLPVIPLGKVLLKVLISHAIVRLLPMLCCGDGGNGPLLESLLPIVQQNIRRN